jgi:DNA helicase II / ATP-dependent DNA helicase PcrA
MKRYVIKRPASPSDLEKLSRFREELNEEQLQVVTSPAGPSLVIAGAGSGKTRTITYRVAYLIEQGVNPSEILLATFTNRAAREMLSRVERLTGGDVRRVWGGTFHRIANLILRRHAAALGYDSSFTIMDSEDVKDFIGSSIEDAGIEKKSRRFPKPEILRDMFSYATNTDKPLAEVIAGEYPQFEPLTDQIIRLDRFYMKRKRQRNVMDYDDLLINWKRLLLEKDEIFRIYKQRFQHLLVDEYQDTNKLQAEIVDLLSSGSRNLMVVGDDAQSIFGWRGAEWSNMYEFPKRYPDTKVYRLETNYRSTPEIVDLANSSIACNLKQFPKKLVAHRPSIGLRPVLVPASNSEQQAAFIASRILELRDENIPLEEICVLYRSHYHSMELQIELTRAGIPYRVHSGVRFFEQAHIKDVVAYLRILVNPRDELAWARVLRLIPQVGNSTANRIWEYISRSEDPLALVRSGSADAALQRRKTGWLHFRELLEQLTREDRVSNASLQIETILSSGYETYLVNTYENAEARIEDLKQLARFSSRFNSTSDFLSELALISTERFTGPQQIASEDVVMGSDEDELLTLSSVHQAKGLEWRVVFIIWAADGKFPSPRALRDAEGEEEERRLWYVSLTRAKDQLYITFPLVVTDFSHQTLIQRPSRFITEVAQEKYEIWELEEQTVFPPSEDEPTGYIN